MERHRDPLERMASGWSVAAALLGYAAVIAAFFTTLLIVLIT